MGGYISTVLNNTAIPPNSSNLEGNQYLLQRRKIEGRWSPSVFLTLPEWTLWKREECSPSIHLHGLIHGGCLFPVVAPGYVHGFLHLLMMYWWCLCSTKGNREVQGKNLKPYIISLRLSVAANIFYRKTSEKAFRFCHISFICDAVLLGMSNLCLKKSCERLQIVINFMELSYITRKF